MAMKLWCRAGWGSALIEAQAAEYGMELELVGLDDPATTEAALAELARLNPLTQLPTLLLDDGQVMTESAAITLYLADRQHSDLLVPGPDAPERAAYLRWQIWLVANPYANVAYCDRAEQLVGDPIEARGLRERLLEQREVLWMQAAEAAGAPWFLGERFSAIDLFLAVMLRWQPGLDWAAEHAPRLYHIAAAASARPAIAPVIARNFPDTPDWSA